jgi:hypothetical protein
VEDEGGGVEVVEDPVAGAEVIVTGHGGSEGRSDDRAGGSGAEFRGGVGFGEKR